MLSRVAVTNSSISTPKWPFDPSGSLATDEIQIRDIQGLGPVSANVNMTAYADLDGEYYTGSTVGRRNIVMTVGFNPRQGDAQHNTYQDLRQELYRYFPPKAEIDLEFRRYGADTVNIKGIVETHDVNHFSQDPEVQISILCPTPEFKCISQISENALVRPVTEDLTENYTQIFYNGNTPAGFQIDISHLNSEDWTGDWTIKTIGPTVQSFGLSGVRVAAGHTISLSTVPGSKFVRNGADDTSLMAYTEDAPDWILLYPGWNALAVVSNISSGPRFEWNLTYCPLYGSL